MRAVVVHQFGPPSVLVAEDVSDPSPGPHQVVVDVAAANITFIETQVRAGRPPNSSMLPALPAILGNGVGGAVAKVGEQVDPELIGRRVVASLGGTGGYAQRTVVDAAALIDVPDALSTPEAVALLADGRTALMLMRAADVQPGETVLVEAAAGGVGSLLVQLAARSGARVVGAAGGERKLQVAQELGASVVVDYTRSGWADRIASEVGSVDVVFDGVGGSIGRDAFELVHAGGRFSAFGMASGSFADVTQEQADARGARLIRGGRLPPQELRGLARAALAEAAAGRLPPRVGQTFPLEHAAEAHSVIERRATIGKTLLLISATRSAGLEAGPS
jgi:NADPH2:quinone reductase